MTVRCARCGGTQDAHGLVHVRHGNGGGHNEPCPNTKPQVWQLQGAYDELEAWQLAAQPLADKLAELADEYDAIVGSIAGLILTADEAGELRRAAAQLRQVRADLLERHPEVSPRVAGGWASAAIRHTAAVRALLA